MKVEATKQGYFGLEIREIGEQFDIPDEPKGKDGMPKAFSKLWMSPVEPVEAKVVKGGKSKKDE